MAGLRKGHSWTSFLKCLCFDLPLLIREAKKKRIYPDVQQHLGAAWRSSLVPPMHGVPFGVTRALLSPCLVCPGTGAGTLKLPWAWWSWRKGGRAHAKGGIEEDRSSAEGGIRIKSQCSCQNRATLPHHANFSSFCCFLLEYQYVLVFNPPMLCEGLPAGFG